MSQLQLEVAENKGMLSELNLEVQQKTDRLAEVELRLKDCLAEKAQEEERLSRRLRNSHETIASLRAQSPPVKVSHPPGSFQSRVRSRLAQREASPCMNSSASSSASPLPSGGTAQAQGSIQLSVPEVPSGCLVNMQGSFYIPPSSFLSYLFHAQARQPPGSQLLPP